MARNPVKFVENDPAKAAFFNTLRGRVNDYFTDNHISKYGNGAMIWKTIILLLGYTLPIAAIVLLHTPFGISLLLWAVTGIFMAGVGMSVMHDANHGAYSSNATINYLLGHTLSLCGGSVFNWKLQHNILHHTYTNIVHMDDDIQDRLVLRFSPHTEVKWYHKFQFVYAFLFYGVLTLYWVLLKDFILHYSYIKRGVNSRSKKENAIILTRIIVMKAFYFTLFFLIPILVFHVPTVEIILGFLVMQFMAGLILTVVFQLAHTVDETTHPLPSDANTIENSWAIHQLNTTVNFSRKNKILSWYVGGLNFQVEHHLFPGICHIHYPEIAPIVKATAEEFGIPYLENPTFADALRSHVRALKRFGHVEAAF